MPLSPSPLRRYFEALLLLLLSLGFLTLASTGRLPWPIVVLAAAAYLARGYAFLRQRRWVMPQQWLFLGLLAATPLYLADGLYWSHNFLDATLHVVVLAGAAKLFNLVSRRDYLSLGLLAVLEVMTAALLTVSGTFFLLFILFLLLLVATLIAHEMSRAQEAAENAPAPGPAVPAAATPPSRLSVPHGPLLRFSLLLSVAVALAGVVIFFVLPRTALGDWNGHRPSRGLSGFSDEVQLGAIASLQRTDNPVMHIRITSADPPMDPARFASIPWRGRALTEFDGRRWYDTTIPMLHGSRTGQIEIRAPLIQPTEIVRYQVTLEPLASPVLFFPAQLLRAATRFHLLAWDRSTDTLTSPFSGANSVTTFSGTTYSGVSNLTQPSAAALAAAPRPSPQQLHRQLRDYLQLPENLDPRIRALARSVTAHSLPDNYHRLEALRQFLQSHYTYSLTDLPQGPDPLATFLFDQPSGDCEYFASALAVMARSLDIPTRLVNGFIIDSYNPISGEYLVKGGDAHSWVEAFFPRVEGDANGGFRRGVWVSFDATPSSGVPPPSTAAAWPGMLLDALSSFWQERFVNYDWLQQAGMLGGLQSSVASGLNRAWQNTHSAAATVTRLLSPGGSSSSSTWVIFFGSLGCLLGAGWAGRRWLRLRASRRRVTMEEAAMIAQRSYRSFQRALARLGCRRAPAQTAQDLLTTLNAAHPSTELTLSAAGFVAQYEAIRFGQVAPLEAAVSALHNHLGRVKSLAKRARKQTLAHHHGR